MGQKSKLKKIPEPKINPHPRKKKKEKSHAEFLYPVECNNTREHLVFHMQDDNFRMFWIRQKKFLRKSCYCRRNGCILRLVFNHLFILQLFLITWSETAPQQLQIVLHIETDPAIPIENSIMPRIMKASVIIISELIRWCPSCKNAVKKP